METLKSVLSGLAYAGFVILGLVQWSAVVDGLQNYCISSGLLLLFVHHLCSYLGQLARIYGAVTVWGWTWSQTALLFFGWRGVVSTRI